MPAAFAVGTSEAIAGPSSAPSITMPWYFFDVTAFWSWEYCFCGLNAASNTARSTPSLAAAAFAPRRFAEFPDVEPAPIRNAMCTVPVGLAAEVSAEVAGCPLGQAARGRSATGAGGGGREGDGSARRGTDLQPSEHGLLLERSGTGEWVVPPERPEASITSRSA